MIGILLNISKTKEIVIDFRKQENNPDSIISLIKEKDLERVGTFKYLGAVLDNKFTGKDNIDVTVSKIKTRMYCLRTAMSFNINPNLLQIFCSSTICSVLVLPSSIGEVTGKKQKE